MLGLPLLALLALACTAATAGTIAVAATAGTSAGTIAATSAGTSAGTIAATSAVPVGSVQAPLNCGAGGHSKAGTIAGTIAGTAGTSGSGDRGPRINMGKTEKPKQMHHQKKNTETMKPLSTHDDFARFSNFLENSLFVVSFFKMDFRRRPFNQKPLVFTNNSRTHPEAQGSFGGEGTFQECHC